MGKVCRKQKKSMAEFKYAFSSATIVFPPESQNMWAILSITPLSNPDNRTE